MSEQQYFTLQRLKSAIPKMDFSKVVLQTKDSYSDEAVLKSLNETGDVRTMAICALQTSLVGSGNKSFGTFKIGNTEMSVEDVYKAKGVKMNALLSDKLEPGDLTPRRLHRIFRYTIRTYLEEHIEASSYLWKKYSDKDEKYRTICYPGSEHLIESKEEAAYILAVYKELDERRMSNISERVLRILSARGLI